MPGVLRTTRLYDFGPDAHMLSQLAEDGRASFEDLAQAVGASRQTAWRRVQSLLAPAGPIWGFGAVIDHQALGWRQYLLTFPGSPDYGTVRFVEEADLAIGPSGKVRVLHGFLLRGTAWSFVVRVAAKNALALEMYLQALRDRLPTVQFTVAEVEYVVREQGFRNPQLDTLKAILPGGAP